MAQKALLLVDVQMNMFDAPGVADADRLLATWVQVLESARTAGLLVVHVQHCEGEDYPDYAPGTVAWQIHPAVAPRPGELTVQKDVPSAFEGTPLDGVLRGLGVTQLVVAGMQSEMCVEATSRAAHALGYDVTLIGDAHGTFDDPKMSAAVRIDEVNRELAKHFSVRQFNEIQW